nr:unnamed protein product [Callosobruchus analis]
MSKRQKSRMSNNRENSSGESSNTELEAVVQKLASNMLTMQDSIKDLAKALGNSSSDVQTKNVKSDEESRKYISLWKDIGAQNLLFIPGGTMHPMLFLKKLERYFEDAGVPDKAKVGLAINCLRSSAADWVANKEASFSSYDIFKDMFKKMYWGEDEERQLFYSIKYGVYNGGNKADYILKLASQVSFLSQEIKEKDLVEMLLGHFGNDIQRGTVLSGVKCIDDLEEYMRKIDFIENNNDRHRRQEDNGRDRARNREEEGNRRYVRGKEQSREPNREVRSIMRFNMTWEDLLSDDEKEKLMTKAERKRTKRQGGLEVVFKEGDAVLVRQHPLSSAEDSIIKKFCLLYEGPFWVSKVINPTCYEVTDGNGLFAGRHNVKNLKKYIA